MEALLQYGVWGVVALVILQVVGPVLKDYVLPAARDQREREIRAMEGLSATLSTFGTVLSAMEQRIGAVERDTEKLRDDVALLVERVPAARRTSKSTPPVA